MRPTSTRSTVIACAILAGAVLVVLWRSSRVREELPSAPPISTTQAPEPISIEVASPAGDAATPARGVTQLLPAPAPGLARPDERVTVRGQVVDGDGEPLTGVEILATTPRARSLRDSWAAYPVLDRGRADLVRALGDDHGRFELTLERGDEIQLALCRIGSVRREVIRSLSADMTVLDLGALKLRTGATLPGHVVDAFGRPVPGARVVRRETTMTLEGYPLDWTDHEVATTATDGSFRLEGLALGPTELDVRAPGFVREHHTVFADAYELAEWTIELEQAAPITGRVVGAPADTELEVYFWVRETSEQHYVPCAADGSFVIDELPADLSPFDLYAVRQRTAPPSNPIELMAQPVRERLSPSTQARPGDRNVELRVPAPVAYRLQVLDATTLEPLSDVRFGLLEGSEFEQPISSEVARGTGGMYTVPLILTEGYEGRALALSHDGYQRIALGQLPWAPGETYDVGAVALRRLAPTTLRLLAPDGSPVDGAPIRAAIEQTGDCYYDYVRTDWPARSELYVEWKGTSAPDGTATAFLSTGQTYWIFAEPPGYAPLELRVVVGAEAPRELELPVRRGGTLVVRCIDAETRAPRAGTSVAYECLDRYGGITEEIEVRPDGSVRLERLMPGQWSVWPAGLDMESTEQLVDVADEATRELVLAYAPERVVRLHGRVTERGRPVAGAVVEAWYDDTVTDIDGEYVLERLDPGENELSITHPRFGPIYTKDLELLVPEEQMDVELELAVVRGIVRDAEQRALAAATVHFGRIMENGLYEPMLEVHCAEDGTFTLEGVHASDASYVEVSMPGFQTGRFGPLRDTTSDSMFVLEPQLQRAAELEVVVEGSAPVFAQLVAKWRGQDELTLETVVQKGERLNRSVDGSGERFRFDRLRPGAWSIEFERFGGDGPVASADVTLEPGPNPTIVLRP